MIKIYKSNINGEIENIKAYENNAWIDLINPNINEIEEVESKTKIPKSLLEKLLDVEELPRIETEGDATLIVIDVPYVEDRKAKNKYYTLPLGIILNKGYLVTISTKEVEVLNEIKKNKIKSLYTYKKTRFVIQMLLRISGLYVKYLNIINKEIETREKTLIKSTSNKELISLMNIQKSLVYFVTSLKSNDMILEKLSRGNVINLYEEDRDLLEDAIIENKQGIETANIFREITSSLTDTYASIISNNLNEVMKFLASITIVCSIPTMISSFMGMNVPLGPLANNPYAFVILAGISLVVAIIIAFILRKRDML
ncbi:MAG: magnesium transporter CorA family protein [Firmicutes bacterium]|nr:magnesium transporter CorA family protein [Bacillota bacterium]